MDELVIGTNQQMTVSRIIDTGYVLEQHGKEAMLHTNEATSELEVGQAVTVFLYPNKKGQVIATMTLPPIEIETYGWADVMEVIPNLGAFVNIGTTKEILVSVDNLPLLQRVWPKPGDSLFVTLGKDRKGRLLAIPASEGVISDSYEPAPEHLLHQEIEGWVYRADKEGSAIITEDGYRGFIHHTERKVEPRLGEFVKGRVIAVKEDGTLNLSLRPQKEHVMLEDAEAILALLKENDGVLALSDKSNPEDIRTALNISKAAFKRALGTLMKAGKIEQRDGKTFLIEK